MSQLPRFRPRFQWCSFARRCAACRSALGSARGQGSNPAQTGTAWPELHAAVDSPGASGLALGNSNSLLALVLQGPQRQRKPDQGGDRDRDRMTKIEPGTIIPVRTNGTIDADRRDDQVYTGIVDQ